jgi:hypothetical protein
MPSILSRVITVFTRETFQFVTYIKFQVNYIKTSVKQFSELNDEEEILCSLCLEKVKYDKL